MIRSYLINGLFYYMGYLMLEKAHLIPLWRTDGIIIIALLHIGPVEFLYYWLHRALHHHFLYSRYHSHHHSSIVTEPITCKSSFQTRVRMINPEKMYYSFRQQKKKKMSGKIKYMRMKYFVGWFSLIEDIFLLTYLFIFNHSTLILLYHVIQIAVS